jgi:colanic acid biosynthesis glycosyl transferase WcaI
MPRWPDTLSPDPKSDPPPPRVPNQTQHPKHVVLLNQAFHPDVVATAQMAKDLADHLVRRGHTVTAVASRSIYGKSGAVLPASEEIPVKDGQGQASERVIHVRRVGFSIFGKRGTLARLIDFAFFYVLAGWKLMFLRKPDVIVGFSTPPYIALLPLLLRAVRGNRCVYWAMDLYPDVPVASGMLKPTSPLTSVLEWLHRYIVRKSNATVVLGRCMRDRLLAKGLPAQKLHFIPVWSDESGVKPVPRDQNPLRTSWNVQGKFVVMYSGNFGLGHDAGTIKGAMLALKDDPSIAFVFVGGGKRRAEIESFITHSGITNASYKDYVPRDMLSQSLCVGDCHLISLIEGMEGLIVPSKLFGIMAAARPALFIGNPTSEIARVIIESNAGHVVRQGDSQGLAQAIQSMAGNIPASISMGENARAALLGKYDASTACDQWARLIEAL